MSNADTIYVVWRRNDGYIDATANHLPRSWDSGCGAVTFTELGRFAEWHGNGGAFEFIRHERKKDDGNGK